MQKRIEIRKFLLLRLELIVFLTSGAPLKNFTKQKKIFLENISCSTNMGEELCQKKKNPICLLSEITGGQT